MREKWKTIKGYRGLYKFNEKMKELAFYNRAIEKNVFDKISCFHHYELQEDGTYKNTSKDSYFSNPERYMQTF